MKEYTKEFDGVTYTFTENDLYEPASYVLKRFKDDMVDAKKCMGSRYTEEGDNKVQSLTGAFIVSSFQNQVDIMSHTLDWVKMLLLRMHFVRLRVLVNTQIGILRSLRV